MEKAATITMRIEPILKARVEDILRRNGLSPAQAIRIFYNQIWMHHGLPFEIKIPNAMTQESIEELESNKGQLYPNMKSLWDSLEE